MSFLLLFIGGLIFGVVVACWFRSSAAQGFECWFVNSICVAAFGYITYYSVMFAPIIILLYPVSVLFGFLTLVCVQNILKDIKYSVTRQHLVMEGDKTRKAYFWENQ